MTELRRELGLFSAALLVVGGIIGSGIFFTPAETARALPTSGWVLAVWTLGGAVALAGALTYAELGAMMPEAGGGYVYVREAFGRLPAFLLGWMTLLMIASGAIAAVAIGIAGYQVALGAPVPPPLAHGVAAAFVAVLFTIGGWQQTNMVAGEIRDPGRTLPKALALGIGIVIVVYLGANVVYLETLGRDGLALSTAVAADTASRLIGPAGATAITVAAMLSIFGFVNVALLTNARVLFALGQDGAFLPSAGKVHPRFGSPHVALVMLGGWSLVLLFATQGTIGTLLSGVVFADWVFFGLGAASVFVLRRTRPGMHRPYRVPGYPWLPAFFVLSAAVGIISAYVSALRMSLVGTGMLVTGAVVYWWTADGGR